MKKQLLFLALMFSLVLTAQTAEQQKILAESQAFMELYDKKDYNKILEMSHPALLEKFDKQVLLSAFKTIFEGNEEFSIGIDKVAKDAYNISDIYTDGSTRYAFVDYPMSMSMVFKGKPLDEDTKKMMVSMMEAQGMKATFTDAQTVNIKKHAMMVAINDASTKNQWKYVNHDANSPMYTMIVPKEIIKKANSYYGDLLLKDQDHAN